MPRVPMGRCQLPRPSLSRGSKQGAWRMRGSSQALSLPGTGPINISTADAGYVGACYGSPATLSALPRSGFLLGSQ